MTFIRGGASWMHGILPAALQQRLLQQLEAHPDATQEEHCQMWEAIHGIKVSPASITRAKQALDRTRKKSHIASEHKEAPRAAWRAQMSYLLSQDLVFVDEFGGAHFFALKDVLETSPSVKNETSATSIGTHSC